MTSPGAARILVVDDVLANLRLLEAVLAPHGYDVVSAADGRAALDLVESANPDLVLLDVVMPKLDGYEVCRQLRAREETAVLPVIMLTATAGPRRRRQSTPARTTSSRSLSIRTSCSRESSPCFESSAITTRSPRRAAELLELNRTLDERVRTQVEELGRLRRLQRFLSPQLADMIVSSGDESILSSHRRQVAMFFADLRGWTTFVDAVEPEELMRVLGEFHDAIGRLVQRFGATVGFIEGDGVQLFFNDPIEIPDAPLQAVKLGCALREEMAQLTPSWQKRGYDLDFGAGIALGYATCGEVGFEGRSDYAAIGAVTNLASRLADEATGGQILISPRLYAEIEDDVEVEPVGELTLKGFQRPVAAFNVIGMDGSRRRRKVAGADSRQR